MIPTLQRPPEPSLRGLAEKLFSAAESGAWRYADREAARALLRALGYDPTAPLGPTAAWCEFDPDTSRLALRCGLRANRDPRAHAEALRVLAGELRDLGLTARIVNGHVRVYDKSFSTSTTNGGPKWTASVSPPRRWSAGGRRDVMVNLTQPQLAMLERAARAEDSRVWAADRPRNRAAASAFWRTGDALVRRGLMAQSGYCFEITDAGRRAIAGDGHGN